MTKSFLKSAFFGMVERVLRVSVTIFFKTLFFFQGRPDTTPALKKVSKLYKSGDFAELFTQIRLWDAPFVEIEKRVPKKGTILDLGCGDGFLVNYLALSEPRRRVIGIEINKERLRQADKGVKNTQFLAGDILRKEFPEADVILLVHVLHHLPSYQAQEAVLQKCYESLKKGGKLIIVEIGRRSLAKYLFTWITDAIIVPILFEKKFFTTKFFYRDTKEWLRLLRKSGFFCKIIPAERGKPFSHIILECYKK